MNRYSRSEILTAPTWGGVLFGLGLALAMTVIGVVSNSSYTPYLPLIGFGLGLPFGFSVTAGLWWTRLLVYARETDQTIIDEATDRVEAVESFLRGEETHHIFIDENPDYTKRNDHQNDALSKWVEKYIPTNPVTTYADNEGVELELPEDFPRELIPLAASEIIKAGYLVSNSSMRHAMKQNQWEVIRTALLKARILKWNDPAIRQRGLSVSTWGRAAIDNLATPPPQTQTQET